MALAAFDTLEKAGFSEPKASAVSVAVRKVHESSDVATKADISELRHDMDAKHELLRHDMAGMEDHFNSRLDKLILQLTFR